jgi:hypothetical protein
MTNDFQVSASQQIERLYCWVGNDGKEEQILGAIMAHKQTGDERWTPLVSADRDRLESFRGVAQTAANLTGCSVFLKCFTIGIVLDRCEPE